MLSLSGYGRSGPRANYLAYAATIASYIGLASSWGYTHGTLTDYVSGAAGALASVAALGEARRSGVAPLLDLAQIDAIAPILTDLYAAPLNIWVAQPWQANHVAGSWLSGIFPSSGIDQWLAVDIEDGSDWKGLCAFLERRDLVADNSSRPRSSNPNCRRSSGPGRPAIARMVRCTICSGPDWRRSPSRTPRPFTATCNCGPGLHRKGRPGGPWSGPLLLVAPAVEQDTGSRPVPPARLGEHTRDVLRRWLELPRPRWTGSKGPERSSLPSDKADGGQKCPTPTGPQFDT